MARRKRATVEQAKARIRAYKRSRTKPNAASAVRAITAALRDNPRLSAKTKAALKRRLREVEKTTGARRPIDRATGLRFSSTRKPFGPRAPDVRISVTEFSALVTDANRALDVGDKGRATASINRAAKFVRRLGKSAAATAAKKRYSRVRARWRRRQKRGLGSRFRASKMPRGDRRRVLG